MSRRNCGGCAGSLRKGTARRALVVERDGAATPAIVCAGCMARAVAFVVPPAPATPGRVPVEIASKLRRRSCSSCGGGLRKGSARRVLVASAAGGIAPAIVCSRCALRAVAIVVAAPVEIAPLCGVCKRGASCVCAECYARSSANSRELLAANVALATTRTRRRSRPSGEA